MVSEQFDLSGLLPTLPSLVFVDSVAPATSSSSSSIQFASMATPPSQSPFFIAPYPFPYPHPASAYAPPSGFSPNWPIWPPPPPAPSSTPTTPAYDPTAHLFCANPPEVTQPHHHMREATPFPTQFDRIWSPPAPPQIHGDPHPPPASACTAAPGVSPAPSYPYAAPFHYPPTESAAPPTAAPPTTGAPSNSATPESKMANGVVPAGRIAPAASNFSSVAPLRVLPDHNTPAPATTGGPAASSRTSSLGYDGNDLASDLPATAASIITFGTKEVSKYLAHDAAAASVHSTVSENPSSPAPSYEGTCRQPWEYQQGGSFDSYAHKVFETMPSLQGRVLTVKLHHKVCPISIETLHGIFLSCGVVEKMIYTSDVHSPRVFIQYQSDEMAAQAIWVLQGKYIPETYCQLEIQLTQGSDLHAFQDYSCEMNFQSGSGGYNVGHNISESPGEEHKRETVQQILSCLPGPNTGGFDAMDHKAQPVDRRMMFLNMLAPIQAKLQNISEKLSQDIKRMESRASKQQAAPRRNPSTQQAINMTDGKALYGLYNEEANGSSIDSCTVLHTNLIIHRDGEGKQGTEDTSSSKASKNEISSQQPPMSATATDQMQFQASESMPNFDEYTEEDSACLTITSDVQDFTLELQPQGDERACNCSVLNASDSLVTRSTQLGIQHSRRQLRLQWNPGVHAIPGFTTNRDTVDFLQTSILQRSGIYILTDPLLVRIQFGVSKCCVPQQCYFRVPTRLISHGIQFLWDPGILSLMDMLLSKTTVPNLMELNHFWAQLLLKYHSCCTTPNAFHQVLYCYLPIVLDWLYSEPVKQLVCNTSMFSSNARCTSIATTVSKRLVLSFGEIAQKGRDVAVVYHAFKLQLEMRKTSQIWHPGIDSLLFLYIWLHVHMIELVDCSAIHVCYLVSAILPPTQFSAKGSSNIKLCEPTSSCMIFHLHQIINRTSTPSKVSKSFEEYTMYYLSAQWVFPHQQGVKKYCNEKNLLSSQNYLQLVELGIIFITFLPP